MSNDRTATLIGSSAIFLWGILALLTTQTGSIPPFLLTALAFSIATGMAICKWLWHRESPLGYFKQPLKVWIVGVGGLFGYHLFYFMALKNAPPVDASLIAYLWPVLIVLFSALLPGERLRWFHLVGVFAGLFGCILLVTNGGAINFKAEYALGYLSALACAFIWSIYSVLSRKLGKVPTDVVGGFCAATAILAFGCHLWFEDPYWPQGLRQWLAIVGLGLGPVGLAFFTWDYGVKRGNIKVLGTLSYSAPLISTLLLIAFGLGEASWMLALACGLIVGGAVIAAKDMLFGEN